VTQAIALTGQWDFARRAGKASWMGAHCHVLETRDGALRLNRLPANGTHALFPASDSPC